MPNVTYRCPIESTKYKSSKVTRIFSFLAVFSMTDVVIPPLKSTHCKDRLAVLGRQLPLDGGGKYKGKRCATDLTSTLFGQSKQNVKARGAQEPNSKIALNKAHCSRRCQHTRIRTHAHNLILISVTINLKNAFT